MLDTLGRVVVLTGHYGSGKTNLAINLALAYAANGEKTALADLDIVNPYFRSSDFEALATANGIELIAPAYARSNLDIPALTARLDAALGENARIIVDVGGDDAGATALGRYSAKIRACDSWDVLYVVNGRRALTQTPADATAILGEIEAAARLKATGIVNCTNLALETTADVIAESDAFARDIAAHCGLPLYFTAARADLADAVRARIGTPVLPVEVYVKQPW